MDMDGKKHRPTAKRRRSSPAAQQRLVYIVVENGAKPFSVFEA